jgi:hypothetical protein
MTTSSSNRTDRSRGLYLAAGFAAVSAVTYLIVASGLAPGDPTAPPAGAMLFVGLAYLGGAGLILTGRRSLLKAGAILNPLAIVAFFVAFLLGNAEIEVVSLISKFSQMGLQVALMMLIRGASIESLMPGSLEGAAVPVASDRPSDHR